MRRVYQGVVVAAVSVTTLVGCARVGTRPSSHSDEALRTVERHVPQEGAFAELDPDGTSVDIQVSDACALQQFEEVRRTHTDERVNETPVVDYTLAVLGAGAAITGAVVLADSGSVYESDETSRQYNPVGKGTAQAIGGITLAAGGIMLTIPIVDAARASGVEKRTTEESVPREALEERVACPRKLRPGRHVVGKVAGEDVELGTTDAQGRLSVDLSSTSIDELQARKNKRMQVFVDGERVGFLSLVPLAKARRRAADEKAWSDADPAACKALAHSEDCRGIERYLEHFPEGRHAEAAGDLLLAAKPKIPVTVHGGCPTSARRLVSD
jgi:hypothetical protein